VTSVAVNGEDVEARGEARLRIEIGEEVGELALPVFGEAGGDDLRVRVCPADRGGDTREEAGVGGTRGVRPEVARVDFVPHLPVDDGPVGEARVCAPKA